MAEAQANGRPRDQLTQFFLDWQEAIQKAAAAQNEALLKEIRFKGAAELIHGPDATWEYNDQTGLRFNPPDKVA